MSGLCLYAAYFALFYVCMSELVFLIRMLFVLVLFLCDFASMYVGSPDLLVCCLFRPTLTVALHTYLLFSFLPLLRGLFVFLICLRIKCFALSCCLCLFYSFTRRSDSQIAALRLLFPTRKPAHFLEHRFRGKLGHPMSDTLLLWQQVIMIIAMPSNRQHTNELE